MISFVFGTINSNFIEHTSKMLQKIKNKKIIFVIPEQCSFWAETQAIRIFSKLKIEVEILSFSRLSHKIFQKYGGSIKETAQKCDKITILNLVLFKLKNELPIYNYLTKKPGFLELLLKTIEQIKNNKISYKDIEQNLKKIQNKSLKLKINEFWLIFKLYNIKLNKIFTDPADSLFKAIKICEEFNEFEETEIFFTQFFYFSKLQLKFIEIMAKQTNLHFNFYNYPNCDIFTETSLTVKKLEQIAAKFNIKISKSTIKKCLPKSKTMLTLEQILIKNETVKICEQNTITKKTNDIKIFAANSIFEEVEWVTNEIIKLTRNNFDFSDITILTTNLKLYKTTIISSLEQFKIPFFIDDLISFQNMSLIKCCKNILQAATSKSEFVENCILILKSDLTKFTTHEIALFENYIYTWNITPKQFNLPFKKNPNGLIKNNQQNENDTLILEIINKIRKNINSAIKKIQNSKNNSKNFALNLINALNILGIGNYNQKTSSKLEIDKLKLEWNSLITVLETIYKSTKLINLDLKQFQFLFQATSKNLNIKQIPPTLNCITIGSVEKTIPNNPKITIILGANEFSLPKKQFLTNQLFSNSDLHVLKELKIHFGKTTEELNNLNKLIAHRIVCSASLKTYFSFITNTTNNNSTKQCKIIDILKKQFNLKIINSQNINFIDKCIDKTQALKQLAIHFNDDTTQANSLKHYFNTFNNKMENTKLSSNQNKNKKAYNNLKISSSQIEQFFTCPFAYFCKYILKIKPIAETNLTKINLGSAFHFVLEKIISNKQFSNFTLTELKQQIKTILKNFININLKNSSQAKETFINNLNKYMEILTTLTLNVQKELKDSGFNPSYFETEINDSAEIKSFKIKIDEQNFIKIDGKIDRIDIKKQNNFQIFRIVDYKTGTKMLNFSDLILGLNLQMLIYAMCVLQSKPHFKISNITYIKILGNLTKYYLNERDPSKEQIEKIKNSGFFQTRFIFQNKHFSNLSFKLKKNELENKVLNEEELSILLKFITIKIKQMANEIMTFDFKHTKHCTNSNLTQTNCYFCPYSEICNTKQIKTIKHLNKLTKIEFFNLILKELKTNEPK